MTQQPNPDPPHDYDDPASARNLQRVQAEVWRHNVAGSTCQCTAFAYPVPMSGTAWAWEVVHDERCREHEDQREALTVHLADLPELVQWGYTERMWEASNEDGRGNK